MLSNAKYIQLLSSLITLLSLYPNCKLFVSILLSSSATLKIEPHLQGEVFSKCKLLWHSILSDGDTLLRNECIKNMVYFLKNTTFKDGLAAFVPEAMKPQIVNYINNGDNAQSMVKQLFKIYISN